MPNHVSEKRPLHLPLGKLVITGNALRVLTQEDTIPALRRHISGDWGDLDEDDKAANDVALIENSRILSAYRSHAGEKFWIITEADRSVTTILLPEDY